MPQSQRHSFAPVVALASWLGVAAGCTGELPSPDRLAWPRVLALKVRASDEATVPGGRVEVLPGETVEVRPVVAGPDGAAHPTTLNGTWIACALHPSLPVSECVPPVGDGSTPTVRDLPPCPAAADGLPQFPCALEPDEDGFLQFPAWPSAAQALGEDLAVMLAMRHDFGAADGCVDALLADLELPRDCEITVKRIPVGPDGELARAAGVAGPPDTDPDRAPIIESGVIEILDGWTDEVIQERPFPEDGEIVAYHGQKLRITFRAAAESEQSYWLAEDGDYVEQQERLTGYWVRTWGGLDAPRSDDLEHQNTWQLNKDFFFDEPERPDEDEATLVFVLRDGRAGTVSRTLHMTFATPG